VDDMVIGDEDGEGDGSLVWTANPPSSSLVNTKKRPDIMTFSHNVVDDSGNIARRSGEGPADGRH